MVSSRSFSLYVDRNVIMVVFIGIKRNTVNIYLEITMHTYAAFDQDNIWGVGETEEAARVDAAIWLGQRNHRGQVLDSIDDLSVAPMTLRFQVAVHEHGFSKDIVLREDGCLDMVTV